MYSRAIDGETYTFEPSGGLLNAALVMIDRETDSHWSLLKNEAIWGEAKGAAMEEIAGAVKMTFGEWKRLHPGTLVLSVEGVEHAAESPYERYFSSDRGFRGLSAADDRLADKAPIYAFHHRGTPHVVPHAVAEGGAMVELGDRQLFVYRHEKDEIFRSSEAWLAPPGSEVAKRRGDWWIGEARWDPRRRRFDGELPPGSKRFTGFDTYWYSWSLTNPGTVILGR